MENASRALEMAAGVLLAVLILSLLAFFFSSISTRPVEEDLRMSAEQLAKFNQEYEVYQKSAAYGVDVISCLNKAISNNEKYVHEKGFLEGSKYDSNYLIDIEISFQSPLEESTELYGLELQTTPQDVNKQDYQETLVQVDHEHPAKNLNYGNIGIKMDSSKQLTLYTTSEIISTTSKTIDLDSDPDTPNYVSLLNDPNNRIEKLAKLDLEKTVENRNGNYLATERDGWTRLVWKTCLNDLKRRKFKCDHIEYSPVTGRVNLVRFTEIRSTANRLAEE